MATEQRDAAAFEQPREDVPADAVRAEPMRGAWRLVERQEIDRVRRDAGDVGREQDRADHQDQDDQPRQRGSVHHEAAQRPAGRAFHERGAKVFGRGGHAILIRGSISA